MGHLYRSPLRVYFTLALLALWGLSAGFHLPISLFPDSSKPKIELTVNYGDLTAEEFSRTYGLVIENGLRGLLIDGKTPENLTATYNANDVDYLVEFQWDTSGEKALREMQTLGAALSATWPEESRRNYSVQTWRENGGFLALSFYSPLRSLDDLYDQLNPLVEPISSRVPDASNVMLFNPNKRHVEIILNPERLATLKVLPIDIERAIQRANTALSGGRLQVAENKIRIEFPRELNSIESLEALPVISRGGTRLQLKDLAEIRLAPIEKSQQVFKTSGVPSLILFSNPKPGGNVKKMADDIMAEVEKIRPQIPPDVEYKILVNPSEFINSSIKSVLHEVVLAAMLAVLILLLFIGSPKNVVTAAIEIPMSIVLAFILMKLFGVNLNLISLGGLALSAGMNVDASVVVMENIFRHFANAKGELTPQQRLHIVLEAVAEVRRPIIASTIASLVVFLPLIMTNGLTNSILGDLAKAVIFSHGMSAIVALVLVPTVRLQMMKNERNFHLQSPIEKQFLALETLYARALNYFLAQRTLRLGTYVGLLALLIGLFAFVFPRLPKEIIGRPETDWIILGINSSTFTEAKQLESFAEKLEFDLSQKYEKETAYTFTQLYGSRGGEIMIRLKDRKTMDRTWKKLEEDYTNTPTMNYWIEPWNPSELPIPDPPHLKWELRGGTPDERQKVAQDLRNEISEQQIFPRVRTRPDTSKNDLITMRPFLDVLARQDSATPLAPADLAHLIKTVTDGRYVGNLSVGTKHYQMDFSVTKGRIKTETDLRGLPVSLGQKVVPLSGLAAINIVRDAPALFRLNQVDLVQITARENENNKSDVPEQQKKARALLEKWKAEHPDSKVSVVELPADEEIQSALDQLKIALTLSVLLIFITMILQFGDVVHALLVLVAIPLGLIGVMLSLWVFHSTISLNSVLGMILLNGIAVANSIILVDFMKKLVDEGMAPRLAAVEASRARLRPILMTSLTTVLGMIPIALGFGEGGRILQPLGIAVAGGLWVSMLFTLFIVPALQAGYLTWKRGGARA